MSEPVDEWNATPPIDAGMSLYRNHRMVGRIEFTRGEDARAFHKYVNAATGRTEDGSI